MDKAKRKRLAAKGWKEGTVAEFSGETSTESAMIEIGLALSDTLKAKRQELQLTQSQLAKRLGTHQPSIARMELGVEHSVTIDLLLETLLTIGMSRAELGAIIAGEPWAAPGANAMYLSPLIKAEPMTKRDADSATLIPIVKRGLPIKAANASTGANGTESTRDVITSREGALPPSLQIRAKRGQQQRVKR